MRILTFVETDKRAGQTVQPVTDHYNKLVFGMYRYEWQAIQDGQLPVTRARQVYTVQPVLSVADVEATAVFYRDKLGFIIDFLFGDPPEHGGISYCDWMTEGVRIQLSKEEEFTPRGDGRVPDMVLYIFVGPEIDALYDRLRTNGVRIVQEIATKPWGLREFVITDNNGHLLRFGTAA
ncbi:MAG: VOC family protein [Chloroflexota bacterium]